MKKNRKNYLFINKEFLTKNTRKEHYEQHRLGLSELASATPGKNQKMKALKERSKIMPNAVFDPGRFVSAIGVGHYL